MDAIPIRSFVSLVARGVTTPRPVVRRIVDARPSQAERLTLVALAATIQAALWSLVGLFAPAVAVGLGGHLILAVVQFVNYVVTATLAYHIGRRFGGSGDPAAVATAVAWHAVLVAALTPLQAGAVAGGAGGQEISGSGALMLIVYAGLNVWLLAACVAEAHRFESTRRVAAATLGLFITVGLLFSLLLGGLRTA